MDLREYLRHRGYRPLHLGPRIVLRAPDALGDFLVAWALGAPTPRTLGGASCTT
jgi:hypothetical protein